MNNLLLGIFLFIFIATAVLTLASLPGWVKIPENYRKILFSSLLLEVVGCIVLLFQQNFLQDKKLELTLNDKACIAISTTGKLSPIFVNDSSLGLTLTSFCNQARTGAIYTLSKETDPRDAKRVDFVLKSDSLPIGSIAMKSLEDLGFFNEIQSNGSEMDRIRFNRYPDGRWEQKDFLNEDWKISLGIDGQNYYIMDTETNKKYMPKKSGLNNFNKNNRELHFIRTSDSYYLVRMTDANLQDSVGFAVFMVLRIKPVIAL